MEFDDLIRETRILERERMGMDTAHALERLISRMAAVERYRVVRKYARGIVADTACGCGFGSWMISKCPAATKVIGIDGDLEIILFAKENYHGEFIVGDIQSPTLAKTLSEYGVETVVSVETIEHLSDPRAFIENVLLSGAKRFVVTFPSYPTSGFNPYHLNDITLADVTEAVGHAPDVAFVLDDAVQVAVFEL